MEMYFISEINIITHYPYPHIILTPHLLIISLRQSINRILGTKNMINCVKKTKNIFFHLKKINSWLSCQLDTKIAQRRNQPMLMIPEAKTINTCRLH